MEKAPRYVNTDKCTGCGECEQVCPVEIKSEYNVGLSTQKAAYRNYAQAVPGAYVISKLDNAPCRKACPAGLNVQGYVQMVKQGKYEQALNIIMQELPLPGILGRVCPRSCEDACRRCEVDEPVAIRALKRLAADQFDPRQVQINCEPTKQESVAIIGSGPAGLSAAYHLARKGIKSTIYEANSHAGGMLRMGIPEHRLPREILDQEIEVITNLGVEIKTNSALGRDFQLNELFDQGNKAVYLAIGAHTGMPLGIPGEKSTGVRQGVDFLREINTTGSPWIGNKVAIVGGGNVAIDVARVVCRLGAQEINIVYRRTREEMPALPEEVEAALEEGINIYFLAAPQEIQTRDGKVSGLRCIQMELGEPDSSGRRRPIPIPESEYDLQVDQVIPAIGQKPDISMLEDLEDFEFTRWGTIDVDPITYSTNLDGVFAGGDAQTGPWIAIGAVAAGREAAESMYRYIQGEDMQAGRTPIEEPEEPNYRPIPDDITQSSRCSMPELNPEERKCSFLEVEQGYDPDSGSREADRCLNCGICSECMQCVEVCQTEAIEHDQKSAQMELNVGSVILSAGFQSFDPSNLDLYQYKNFGNVITSLEFERILSATGPFQGDLIRPSDHAHPRKIAWLQCVGSRDINRCNNAYCSAVCCMYAIKQSMIAKEHTEEPLDTAIFYMDMRAFGKDFEKYYQSAKDEQGVRFVPSKIHSLQEDRETGDLILEYMDENGELQKETFNLVILSTGMETSPQFIELSQRLDIDLDKDNLVDNFTFNPVETSRDGIYACGAIQEPKDIPGSVVEASAAACEAEKDLWQARGSQAQSKTYPKEKEIADQEPRIGVFVCNCGSNIGGIVDVPQVVEHVRGLPNVEYVEDNLFTCSQDTQDKMKEIIQEKGLNRVVVGACTPRTHEPLFQETLQDAGLNKYLFEMANIRNHCSWVHSREKEQATEKAKDLVSMAISRCRREQPLDQPSIGVNNNAMVIGGGVSGMSSALGLAEQGFHTYLVERSPELGGNALHLNSTWKGDDVQKELKDMVQKVKDHKLIDVYTQAELKEASGFVGNFKTTIVSGSSDINLEHGAVIIATGGEEYKPGEYLYGQDERILTHLDLDATMANKSNKIEQANTAVFIQCVGSREPERPYCSKVCCTHSIKSAISMKKNNPEMQIYILYRDIRTYGQREELYQEARKLGVVFIRYNLEEKPEVTKEDSDLKVRVKDHILQQNLEIGTDLVVLASAIVPRDNDTIAGMFKLPLTEDNFFMEAHAKLRPVEFANDGLFVTGMAHYPKPLEESISQAKAAASRAAVILSKDQITVEGEVSQVNEELCRGCGECVEACPYNAIGLEELDNGRMVARVQAALCKGCGSCAVACPTGAAGVRNFEDDQILTMVGTALEREIC